VQVHCGHEESYEGVRPSLRGRLLWFARSHFYDWFVALPDFGLLFSNAVQRLFLRRSSCYRNSFSKFQAVKKKQKTCGASLCYLLQTTTD
jgi:hypothetical protein